MDSAYKIQLLDAEGGSTYSQFSIDFIGDNLYHTYTINVSESWANLEKINQLKLLYGEQETNRGQIVIKRLTLSASPEIGDIGSQHLCPRIKHELLLVKIRNTNTVTTSDNSLLPGNAVKKAKLTRRNPV